MITFKTWLKDNYANSDTPEGDFARDTLRLKGLPVVSCKKDYNCGYLHDYIVYEGAGFEHVGHFYDLYKKYEDNQASHDLYEEEFCSLVQLHDRVMKKYRDLKFSDPFVTRLLMYLNDKYLEEEYDENDLGFLNTLIENYYPLEDSSNIYEHVLNDKETAMVIRQKMEDKLAKRYGLKWYDEDNK